MEDLTANPQANLSFILNFLGTDTNSEKLLNRGQLPLANISGSKGRLKISSPQWPNHLKKQIIEIIQPDTEAFLQKIQKPLDTWKWY